MGKLIRFRRKGKARDEAARALFPPFQSAASDARPAAFPSDASPDADLPRAGVAPDPAIVRKRARKRRGTIVALLLIFAGGIAAALFGDHGYLDNRRQQARLQELRESTEAREQHVKALNREIERLKVDPSAVERIAREELGYVAPGEITLLLPADAPADAHGLDAKAGSGIVPAARSTH